jgi:hypothetical protein
MKRGAAMKAKKALRKLAKIESSLADVIDQYSPSTRQFQELLASAKNAIAEAKSSVNPDGVTRKPPARAKTAKKRGITSASAGRKRSA